MKTLKRRRKERKTNYLKRIKLLKSGVPRLVFRKTNRYLIAQYTISKEAKDKVDMGVNSKILLQYGWPIEAKGSLKSLPAAYLLGVLMGNKITKKNLKAPIIDFGLYRALHKSKLYAFIKGLVDSGVEIKSDKKTFPEEARLKTTQKKIPLQEIKSKIEKEPFHKKEVKSKNEK